MATDSPLANPWNTRVSRRRNVSLSRALDPIQSLLGKLPAHCYVTLLEFLFFLLSHHHTLSFPLIPLSSL